MHICKILKRLTIALSVMIIAACSSFKMISGSLQRDNDKHAIKNVNKKDNLSDQEQVYLRQVRNLQNDIVYFDLDKYNIRSNFLEMLDIHSNFLRNNPSCKVKIEGHTDERGTPEYNISLGERRANAVKMYLQSKGVHSKQISIISYGKEKPAVLGHNETAYERNRRAVLLY